MGTINEDQVLVTTQHPDTWSGDGLRRDAYRMAETFLAFCHATMNGRGVLSDVRDIESMVASLERIVGYLPQVLQQLGEELDRAHDAGYIEHRDGQTDKAVAAAKLGLSGAADNTKMLEHHLHQAQRALDLAFTSKAYDTAMEAAGTEDDESWEG